MCCLKYELLLYDIMSTYFEGQCAANPLAKRGYSRDHRPDCLQVLIGLVVTEDGFPLGYEVFAGNRHNSTPKWLRRLNELEPVGAASVDRARESAHTVIFPE